jgi:hypothetical protein
LSNIIHFTNYFNIGYIRSGLTGIPADPAMKHSVAQPAEFYEIRSGPEKTEAENNRDK